MQDEHFSSILDTYFVQQQWLVSIVVHWLMNRRENSVSIGSLLDWIGLVLQQFINLLLD